MESNTKEGAPVAEGLPEETNGIGDSKKKRQRQKHTHHWQKFMRVQIPGGGFPAKFVCQPIKLELYPLATLTPRIKCACTNVRWPGSVKTRFALHITIVDLDIRYFAIHGYTVYLCGHRSAGAVTELPCAVTELPCAVTDPELTT